MSITQPRLPAIAPGEVKQTSNNDRPVVVKHPKRKRTAFFVTLLTLLGVLLLMGGDMTRAGLPKRPAPVAPLPSGPFVMLPLTADQLNSLTHLSDHMRAKALAQLYVSHMTLDEKLGQLFMVQSYDRYYSPDLQWMVNQLHAGGVIMYAFQMQTFNQTKHDIMEEQLHASIPLIVATDEEGGFVERVQNIFGDRPGALQTYQTGDVNKAAQLGHGITHDLQSLGINADLAPDVDVQQVDGPDQYLRTWGYTPQSVIQYGGAYLQAVQGDGEIACLKHWPGLGAATTDAHFSLPVVKQTADQIYSTELAPFKAFIQSHNPLLQPAMIMSTDISMPAIDPVWPAELSPTFMTDILRKQFGYDGVVITDALWMTGISQHWNLIQAGVLALKAGNDMLLGAIGPYQMMDMLNGLKAALQDGTLSMDRVNEAVTRIITMKIQYHIIPVPWIQ